MNLELHDITRVYGGAVPTRALDGVSLCIDSGEMVCIVGRSGSGKSTLLNILALLDTADSGAYTIDGSDVTTLTENARATLRSRTFGFVFQSFHLLETRTLVENVELGLVYQGTPPQERRERALAALETVGLVPLALKQAVNLSGGERQRVALARAIVTDPDVIVADEPTGNLDSRTSAQVMDSLARLKVTGAAVVVVTHDMETTAWADRVIEIADGTIVGETRPGRIEGAERRAADTATAAATATATATATVTDTNMAADMDTEDEAGEAPARGGGHITVRDTLRDAWAGVRAHRRRAASVVVAMALGVGLVLATLGLGATTSAQVSDRFDARLNRYVTASWQPELESADPQGDARLRDHLVSSDTLDDLATLSGVTSTAAVLVGGERPLRGLRDSTVQVFGASGDLRAAGEMDMAPQSLPGSAPEPGAVWVGYRAAESLGIGPLESSPTLDVDGMTYVVTGIIEDSPRVLELNGSAVFSAADATRLAGSVQVRVLLTTMAGAAPQVASQAALATYPADPDVLLVESPPDPVTLRQQIEGDLALTLTVLSGLAMLAAFVALTSTMTVSVVERTAEFGLRRAIGARRRDVRALVVAEAALLGFVGALVGAYVAFLALLGITLVNRWVPIFDLRWIAAAALAGVVVGVLGSLLAARKAARIEPSAALRSV